MINYDTEIHKYYLDKCRDIARGAVLKTDLWNEVRLDVPGSGAIICNLAGVEKWYAVEVAEQRLSEAKKLYDKKNVRIIAGKIQDVEFAPGMFDAIICLATINYMGFPSCTRTLLKFRDWVKDNGNLYVSAWVWDGYSTEKDSKNNDERIYHNQEEFESVLEYIFDVYEKEVITSPIVHNRVASLVGYKCKPFS